MSRDRTRTNKRPNETNAEVTTQGEISDEATGSTETDASVGGLRARTLTRAEQLFSPRVFVATLVLAAGGFFAASILVPLPGSGLLGVFAATFLLGFAVDDRRYAETALAGGIVAATSTLLDFAVVAFLGGFGVSIAVLAGALGAIVGGLGAYFGRDLRDGLTRDL